MTDLPDNSEGARVADHRENAHIGRSINKLSFPYAEKPSGDTLVELADGVFWARIPLPWALDHINVYLFDEGDSWTLVDTGSLGSRGTEAWEALFAGPIGDKPIGHVVGTHMHPDHIGLAGWICERFSAKFSMTMGEYLMVQQLWLGAADEVPDAELEFLWRAGVNPQVEAMVRKVGYSSFKKGVYKMPSVYNRLEDGSRIKLGGRPFTVVIGRGHSPEHACLVADDGSFMISGDQVLPGITSNVSVFAREPEANSLGHWLTALDRLKGLKVDPIVLPSHGKVFKGLHIRLDDLIAGHMEKLRTLTEHLAEPHSAVDCFPALYSREVTGFDFFMALGEALAHLNFLRSVGVVERTSTEVVDSYRAVRAFEADEAMEKALALPGVALRPLSTVVPHLL